MDCLRTSYSDGQNFTQNLLALQLLSNSNAPGCALFFCIFSTLFGPQKQRLRNRTAVPNGTLRFGSRTVRLPPRNRANLNWNHSTESESPHRPFAACSSTASSRAISRSGQPLAPLPRRFSLHLLINMMQRSRMALRRHENESSRLENRRQRQKLRALQAGPH